MHFLISDNFTLTLGKETQPIDCSRRHEIMSNVVEAASPYLYPCVIQYSLIATGMYYQGCHVSGKSQGKTKFSPGQGIVREF